VETLFARWIPQSYRNFMQRHGRYAMLGVLMLLSQLGVFNFIFEFASNVVWGGILRLILAILGVAA
jgi:hypothetical protein